MFNFDFEKIETEYTKQITNSLKTLEKQLNLLPLESNYHSVMVLCRYICETSTSLLLFKKDGIEDYQNRKTFRQTIDGLYEYDIIPKECYDFLELIRIHGNSAVHGYEITEESIISFLKAFNFFVQWFDNYYSQNYQLMFPIKQCSEMINSIIYDKKSKKIKFDSLKEEYSQKNINELKIIEIKTYQEISNIENEINEWLNVKEDKFNDNHFEIIDNRKKSLKKDPVNEKIEKLTEELRIKEELHQKQIEKLNKQNKEILKQLDEYRKLFERSISIFEESNERTKRMETKIDELHTKIDHISNQIRTIQSITERQIDNAQSTEEIERVIGTYIDECIENIMSYSQNFTENQNYNIERRKLIYSIGEEGWNKLSEKSKTFLITSKVMYNHLITMDDIIDYSGICVLVTKALEVEMHKRFFTDFLDYLHKKYGTNYKKYHTALLYQKRKPLLSEKFTMGNIAYVMCYNENKHDNDSQKNNNKIQLMKYCKKCVFSKYDEDKIEKLLKVYASKIEEIREKYRNPSAHTNEIKRIDAEECFNLVLDIEKLLKKMLDSFDK